MEEEVTANDLQLIHADSEFKKYAKTNLSADNALKGDSSSSNNLNHPKMTPLDFTCCTTKNKRANDPISIHISTTKRKHPLFHLLPLNVSLINDMASLRK